MLNRTISTALANNRFRGPATGKEDSEVQDTEVLELKESSKILERRPKSAVPIAQFVRAVEAGLSTDHVIKRVKHLRVPLSSGRIRREREEMVVKWSPFTVNSAMEKETMRHIQKNIDLFLQSLRKSNDSS